MHKNPIKILFIEDCDDDRALIEHKIKTSGIHADFLHAETKEDIVHQLKTGYPDLIISDYNMPELDGMDALRICRKVSPDTPFVLISGTVGEDIAVEAVLAGADDYIMKDNLNRLATTIERELRNYKLAREKKESDRLVRETESRLASLIEFAPGAIWSVDQKDRLTAFNQRFEKLIMLQTGKEVGMGDYFPELITHEFAKRYDDISTAARDGKQQHLITVISTSDGSEIILDVSVSPGKVKSKKQTDITFLAHDITEKMNTERDLEMFFNQTEDIICTISFEGEVINVNPAFERILGYPRTEVVGHKLSSFLYPENGKPDSHSVYGTGRIGKDQFLNRFKSKNDRSRWLSWKTVPLKKRNIIYAIARDVTEQKEKEKQVYEYAERQRRILESISDALIVVDNDETIVYMNPLAEQQLEMSSKELIGGRIWDKFSHVTDSLFYKKFQEAKETGQSQDYEEFFEPLEKWFRVNLYPSDEGYSIYFHDVTHAKIAKQKAETSELRFKKMFENSLEGIMITGEEGVITEANRAACNILGYKAEELTGKDRNLILEASREEVKSILDNRKRQGFYHGKVSFRHKSGSLIPVEFTSTEFFDISGQKKIGYIFRDISARLDVENKLKDSLKEKEVMLAEIHHRVKNNLAIISGLLMMQSEQVNEQIRQTFQESIQRIKSMALIHEMLYHSETFAYVNFADYLEKMGESIADSFAKKDLNVELSFISPEPVYLDINSAIPCGLIINELISNSYKHAFKDLKNGVISVSIEMKGDTCIFSVEDNGVGLPEDYSSSNLSSLGYTLIVGLVDQINGELSIEREKGTKVTVKFEV